MSSAIRTSRSRPRSTGSSPTRSTPAGCCRVLVCRPSASWERRCESTRTRSARSIDGWPTPGYVTSRHGAGTHVADRPPQRRGTEALAGIVSEMLRRAAQPGFTADELAAATFAAATERKRPGPARPRPLRRMHERRRRLRRRAPGRRVPGHDRGRGRPARRPARAARAVPLRPRRDDDVPRRRGPGAGRRSGPGRGDARRARATSSWSTRSPACRAARGSGSCARRSAARTTSSRRSRCRARPGVEIVSALIGERRGPRADRPDRRPHPDVARGPGRGPRRRASRGPERIRPWTYEFDPSGLELLRRAIEHVAATRPRRGRPA